MPNPIFKPKLPNYGNKDGDQIIDSYGNVYEFNLETNQWIYRGVIPQPETVTETADGLVSPEIYQKLALIQELMDQGYDFSSFKLDTQIDNPYYYYFNSSDDLIRFTPEKSIIPKEIKLTDAVQSVSTDNGQTLIELNRNLTLDPNELIGFRLETKFGAYNILSNTASVVNLSGTGLNLLRGDLIKIFKPEVVKNQLRVEIDRGRLFQKLMRNCCVGPKGPKGLQGSAGRDGIPADDEVFRSPDSITDDIFSFSAKVATPIDTQISVRIFRGESIIIEFLHSANGTEATSFVINDPNISIDQTTVDFDYDVVTEEFVGSFQVSQGAEGLEIWKYKIRQKGPKGQPGEDGKAFFVIEDDILDDPVVQSSQALSSLRKGSEGNLLVYNRELFSEIPASNLGALEGDQITNLSDTLFVGLEPTIRNAKGLGFFSFEETSFNVPSLDLPSWTPTGDCVQARRWAQYRFEWFNKVDPKYMFSILSTPKPPSQCCQDDLFFCPNVGDEPCGIIGSIDPPRVDVPCDCDCENPISAELGGDGFIFDLIDLTIATQEAVSVVDDEIPEISDGNNLELSEIAVSGINSIQSVVDGVPNEFVQPIRMCGRGEISATVEFDPNVCGGETKERTSCAFIDSDAVNVMFVLEDKNKVSDISSDGVIESPTMPVTGTFFVNTLERPIANIVPEAGPGQVVIPVDTQDDIPDGLDGLNTSSNEAATADLELRIIVNAIGLNLCRGMRITVRAFSDRTNCVNLKSFIISTPSDAEVSDLPSTGTETLTVVTAGPGSGLTDPDDPENFVPESSFAPEAQIISGVEIVPREVINEGTKYALGFDVSNVFLSSPSNNTILIHSFDVDIGNLASGPGVPLPLDLLNDNVVFHLDDITLNRSDAGFDRGGPYGVGTYVLGRDFGSNWNSRIPNIPVRDDNWSNVIGFFNEPVSGADPFRVRILARVLDTEFINCASSYFATKLSNSGIRDGLLFFEATSCRDTMKIIKNGEIGMLMSGKIWLIYGDISMDYPEILISPMI